MLHLLDMFITVIIVRNLRPMSFSLLVSDNLLMGACLLIM